MQKNWKIESNESFFKAITFVQVCLLAWKRSTVHCHCRKQLFLSCCSQRQLYRQIAAHKNNSISQWSIETRQTTKCPELGSFSKTQVQVASTHTTSEDHAMSEWLQTHTIFCGVSPVGAHFFKFICFLFTLSREKTFKLSIGSRDLASKLFCTKIIYNHRRETVAQQLFFTSFSDFVSGSGYLCACTLSDFNKLTTNCLQFYILFRFTSSLSRRQFMVLELVYSSGVKRTEKGMSALRCFICY